MTLAEPTLYSRSRNQGAHSREPQHLRWSYDEYARLSAEGWFQGERVQLIQGEIINMPPQGHRHFLCLDRIRLALERIFGSNHWIRTQAPLTIGDASDPEPDIAICQHPMGYYTEHPSTALLVVEVSDTSLRLDRRKAGLYASAGVGEYWIIDLNGRRVEVYRQPMVDEAAEFGWRYGQMRILEESDTLDLLTHPDANIKVHDLLA